MENQITSTLDSNIQFIENELAWFSEILNTRLKLYFNHETGQKSIFDIVAPKATASSAYGAFLDSNQITFDDRVCLILSLVPYIKPQLLDCLNIKNADTDQRFAEFGCIRGNNHNGLIPTLETLLFILAGDNVFERVKYLDYFSSNHFYFQKKLINLEHGPGYEPFQSATLVPSVELVELLLKGRDYSPEFSHTFPACKITTGQTWDDLVLDSVTIEQINEMKTWIEIGDRVLDEWDLRSKIKPGYRSLFYGPSGTGKTFTATLLGKYTGRDVYRIDLSMVVSKYIGETEKNLSKIFDRAENKSWILFFDEADALFGKRTNIKDAHDRYANQEVSFLLQRVEDYNGLVILSTNLKSNIDDAFARRFQNVIHFTIPNPEQRRLIWQKSFSAKTTLDTDVDLTDISQKYELTGGSILNVVRYCSLMAMSNNSKIIRYNDIINGIRKEFLKGGKTI